jgi:tRNA G46 methylase TrmB
MKRQTDIKALLEKYFEGLTSLEEEQALREYFQGEKIDPELKIYQPLFQFFANARPRVLRLPSLAWRGWGKGLSWLSIAAAACILLFIGLKLTHRTLPETSQAYIDGKKYTNIEVIQIEALKALDNLSDSDEDVYSSQIEALNLFLDND